MGWYFPPIGLAICSYVTGFAAAAAAAVFLCLSGNGSAFIPEFLAPAVRQQLNAGGRTSPAPERSQTALLRFLLSGKNRITTEKEISAVNCNDAVVYFYSLICQGQ